MADYCSLSDLKAALRLTDTVDDALLGDAITSASRWVDGYCERDFAVAAGTAVRDYVPTARYEPLLIEDATAIVEVRIDDDLDYGFATVLVADVDYQAEPKNAEAGGLAWPYTRLLPFEDGYWPIQTPGRATVRVKATYGWPAVPSAVKHATLLQASRLFARLDSPLGVAGFGDLGAMRVSARVDPDVEMLLQPYRRFAV